MSKWIGTALIVIFGWMAHANYLKDFTKQIYVLGVGQVKFNYRFSGEPVSRPRSFEIWVKCQDKKDWEPVGEYQMCELTSYLYDAPTKKLTLKYIDGRVNQRTGESVCDQMGESELALGMLCVK